jgi:hypothetical protein
VTRSITTLEAQYQRANGSYADLPTLADWSGTQGMVWPFPSSAYFQKFVDKLSAVNNEGFEIRLMKLTNAYSLQVTDTRDRCRLSFFADERAVIYDGKAVDCMDEGRELP